MLIFLIFYLQFLFCNTYAADTALDEALFKLELKATETKHYLQEENGRSIDQKVALVVADFLADAKPRQQPHQQNTETDQIDDVLNRVTQNIVTISDRIIRSLRDYGNNSD